MLRSLTMADMPAIREINAISLGYPVTLELTQRQFKKMSKSPEHLLIGFEDDLSHQIVGYIHAEVYESLYSESGLNILALSVLPDCQGQGIGKALILALEKQAKEQGFSFIRLNSASHREEAHAFYRKMNYNGDKTQLRFIKEL
ncbi:GNAT family N-acetyltransferase [Streptococcus thoraltensis]|uniref:GNAT family N-acetyltransferase n=1 Tax=Streptococcus thoraltensis TaxID=55085 RepID=UPI00037B9F07|nr:GNAT family N-acetyltransferase [Streptococcus thoraltensis]MDY4761009.1 GNAT family N-acetyltransferase [Streptococcus thoraltensis]